MILITSWLTESNTIQHLFSDIRCVDYLFEKPANTYILLENLI